MFDDLLSRLVGPQVPVHSRADGVVFFQATKKLYGVSRIGYLGMNIQIPGRPDFFLHCAYSDTRVKHCMTPRPVCGDAQLGHVLTPVNRSTGGETQPGPDAGTHEHQHAFLLRSRAAETAIFGISGTMATDAWDQLTRAGMGDIKALGNYFHSHVLRINGYNADNDMLISARELDCLKWTAAGKTAWEASVILGISERTVRFHLNAAREKLQCATTTQAVAKAISYQLIDV